MISLLPARGFLIVGIIGGWILLTVLQKFVVWRRIHIPGN